MHIHDVFIEIIARSFSNGDSRSREEKKECFYYIYIYISSLKYKENIEDSRTKFHPWKLSSFAIEDLIEDRSDKADRNDPLCIIYTYTYTKTSRLTK